MYSKINFHVVLRSNTALVLRIFLDCAGFRPVAANERSKRFGKFPTKFKTLICYEPLRRVLGSLTGRRANTIIVLKRVRE